MTDRRIILGGRQPARATPSPRAAADVTRAVTAVTDVTAVTANTNRHQSSAPTRSAAGARAAEEPQLAQQKLGGACPPTGDGNSRGRGLAAAPGASSAPRRPGCDLVTRAPKVSRRSDPDTRRSRG